MFSKTIHFIVIYYFASAVAAQTAALGIAVPKDTDWTQELFRFFNIRPAAAGILDAERMREVLHHVYRSDILQR